MPASYSCRPPLPVTASRGGVNGFYDLVSPGRAELREGFYCEIPAPPFQKARKRGAEDLAEAGSGQSQAHAGDESSRSSPRLAQ